VSSEPSTRPRTRPPKPVGAGTDVHLLARIMPVWGIAGLGLEAAALLCYATPTRTLSTATRPRPSRLFPITVAATGVSHVRVVEASNASLRLPPGTGWRRLHALTGLIRRRSGVPTRTRAGTAPVGHDEKEETDGNA
jgi:hypothetical protein